TALDAERQIKIPDSASGIDEMKTLIYLLVLAGNANASAGFLQQAEALLLEAREKALGIVGDRQLSNTIPLATAERALGDFYARQRRTDEARASYKQLNDLWQSFSETNDYLEIQRAAGKKLLASLD